MLLFNANPLKNPLLFSLFQNISCYCLTVRRRKADFKRTYFKTSHVIV